MILLCSLICVYVSMRLLIAMFIGGIMKLLFVALRVSYSCALMSTVCYVLSVSISVSLPGLFSVAHSRIIRD